MEIYLLFYKCEDGTSEYAGEAYSEYHNACKARAQREAAEMREYSVESTNLIDVPDEDDRDFMHLDYLSEKWEDYDIPF